MELKSFVLIEKNQRYLLIQEAAPKWEGKWFLPGGGLKKHETLEMAAKREVQEEAGCDVELTAVFFVKQDKGFFNKKISVFFCGKMIGEHLKTTKDRDSLAVRWFSYDELATVPLRGNLKELINAYRSHHNFIPVNEFVLKNHIEH